MLQTMNFDDLQAGQLFRFTHDLPSLIRIAKDVQPGDILCPALGWKSKGDLDDTIPKIGQLVILITKEPPALFTFFNDVTTWQISFDALLQRFLIDRDTDGQSYFGRYHFNSEPLETVLFDLFTNELKGRIENSAYFTRLINALIITLEGGDAGPYLFDQDPYYQLELHTRQLDEFYS